MTDWILRNVANGADKGVVVVCGNGNNGGEDSSQKMIAMLRKFINLYEKEIQNEKSEKDNQEN